MLNWSCKKQIKMSGFAVLNLLRQYYAKDTWLLVKIGSTCKYLRERTYPFYYTDFENWYDECLKASACVSANEHYLFIKQIEIRFRVKYNYKRKIYIFESKQLRLNYLHHIRLRQNHIKWCNMYI